MKKLLTSLLAFSLLLAGCGSSEEENIDKNTGKKQLVVAMDCGSAPYTYLAETQSDHTVAFGKSSFASGFDVMVARDLAKSLKKELVIKKMSSSKFAQALEDGDVDMVMNGMVGDSDDSMTYSSVYYDSSLAIVVRKDDKSAQYTNVKQFKKVNMLGQSGMSSDRVINQIKGVKHQKAKNSIEDMIRALKTSKTDAIVVDNNVADKIIHQNGDLVLVQLAKKKGFKTDKGLVIGFKEGSEEEELYKNVENFIKKMKKETNKTYMDTSSQLSPAWVINLEENKK